MKRGFICQVAIRRIIIVLYTMLAVGCSHYGDSIKMLTFNVQFLPGSDDDKIRSVKIAKQIKSVAYDIIVLNEVFDEEAREVFVTELSGIYPNYVAYLGDDAVGSQDSGLMLFSRYPFEPLPNDIHKAESDDVDARNNGDDWKEVAFIEYDDDVFPDNWAAKGVGFVRIRNPHTKRIYNVAFTHMQASYPEDEEDQEEWLEPINARIGQFNDIKRIIEESLHVGQFNHEDIFILGDFNVDGDLLDYDFGISGYDQPNLYEWNLHFSTRGSFFTDIFQDSWANEQPLLDRGLTNLYHWGPPFSPDQGARLDYFLRNKPKSNKPLCVQHLTLAHNMRSGIPKYEAGFGLAGPEELSDHIGINIDVNIEAPHCSPKTAKTPPLEDWVNGVITNRGNVQWYRFDLPGTYSFVVSGAGMDYRVYSGSDMSTPIPEYKEETITFLPLGSKQQITGGKFAFPNPPYYVKVFSHLRSVRGEYQFIAHRASCSSKEEACLLRANESWKQILPAAPINEDDNVWYELFTEKVDGSRPQTLHFYTNNYSQDKLNLSVIDEDGVSVLVQDNVSRPDPKIPGGRLLEITTEETGPSKLYLNVKRMDTNVTSFEVGWETNLTILHGQNVGVPGAVLTNLYCVAETDEGFLYEDLDEIWLTIEVDDMKIVDDVYIGDFDNGDYRSMEDYLGKVGYIDKVKITLRDEDGGLNGNDDFLTATIIPLPVGTTEKMNETSLLSCCDGEYLLRYNRSRSLLK